MTIKIKKICIILISILIFQILKVPIFAKELETRGVWVSYYEVKKYLKAENEDGFRQNLEKMLDNLEEHNINRLIIHVRPFSDAIYPSKFFPWSKTVCNNPTKGLDYDPLKIIISEAHKRNIKVEAWVNPLRVKLRDDSLEDIADTSIAYKWLKKEKRYVRKLGNKGIWYDPAYQIVSKLVANGVGEIVKNYDIDSVQFDDYFYPTTETDFDDIEFKKSGEDSLSDWRRKNINKLVSRVYKTIKKINPKVTFGISPQGNKENNWEFLFADTKKWCSKNGYVDYICPEIYYGFKNKTCPFKETLDSWEKDISKGKELFVGIAGYKVGKKDKYAGEAGKNEWIENQNILEEQINCLKESKLVSGFYYFSYQALENLNS